MKSREKLNSKVAPDFNTCSKISREKRSIFSSQKSGMAAKRQSVYLKTFGCQMNDRDSEALTGLLKDRNFSGDTFNPVRPGICYLTGPLT